MSFLVAFSEMWAESEYGNDSGKVCRAVKNLWRSLGGIAPGISVASVRFPDAGAACARTHPAEEADEISGRGDFPGKGEVPGAGKLRPVGEDRVRGNGAGVQGRAS